MKGIASAAKNDSLRDMRTAVLIPCYNEAVTIGKVVRDFIQIDPTVTVYVCDNDCTDGTDHAARAAGAQVLYERRRGKGWAVRKMFREIEADFYVMVDGDDTYPAEQALALRDLVVDGADMATGDRLSSTYFEENNRLFHGAGNLLVRHLVNRLFGAQLLDILTGCRCMSRSFVKTMPVLARGFEIEIDMTLHALDKGFIVQEVPISYRDRPAGSISKLDTVSDGARVIWTFMQLFRDYRPMRFFGVISAFLLLVSLAAFLVPFLEYLETGLVRKFPTLIVSTGLMVAAMLTFSCGVLLDSIRSHHRQAFELQLNRLHEDNGA